MGGAIAFVLTLATIITWCVQKYVLDPFGLQYLQTLAFILVIAHSKKTQAATEVSSTTAEPRPKK
jgi:Na+-translocating ferredoxin:NAD+ oxidoreductase RnfA subunit